MKKRIVLHLTGGLGNQLFQFAAAASITEEIEVDIALGKPRSANGILPDLFDFYLPFTVTKHKSHSRLNLLSGKAIGFALRSGVAPKRIEKNRIVSKAIEHAVSIVLFLRTKTIYTIFRGKGVGYSPIKKTSRPSYLIGYFQSYRYPQAIYYKMMEIEPISQGPELKTLMKLSETDKPLIVHFRFGDYLKENNFGIPGHEYYLRAIRESWNSGRYKSIWVFSDDISSAKDNFPKQFLQHVRWIEDVDASPASTLQAMRFGYGYVIGNSTFSWWGAYLSKADLPPVTAPSPWFRGMESPQDILPPHWKTLDSDF